MSPFEPRSLIRRQVPAVLTLLAGLMLCGALAPREARSEDVSEHPLIGARAPHFRLRALDGETVDLDALSGRFVIVHFATTWCPYCNAEAPALQRLHETYGERGVSVLVIDVKEDREQVMAWAARHRWGFPVLLDADGTVTGAYAPEVHPDLPRDEVPIASNLLIDREGRIQFYSLLDSRRFDAKLAGLERRLAALLEAE